LLIKERANPRKLRKIVTKDIGWRNFPPNYWRDFPSNGREHSRPSARRTVKRTDEEYE